jgi:hypothetical protein
MDAEAAHLSAKARQGSQYRRYSCKPPYKYRGTEKSTLNLFNFKLSWQHVISLQLYTKKIRATLLGSLNLLQNSVSENQGRVQKKVRKKNREGGREGRREGGREGGGIVIPMPEALNSVEGRRQKQNETPL